MRESCRGSRGPITCVLGIALIASCIDPFKPDFVPQPGVQPGGTGGSDSGKNGGTGGDPMATGGSGGSAVMDAAMPGVDAAAPPETTPDAAPDRPAMTADRPPPPDLPVYHSDSNSGPVLNCPDDPPVPDGAEGTCPAD